VNPPLLRSQLVRVSWQSRRFPGVGPILGAVFVAEVGNVHRFDRAEELTCWAGLTPNHHESDKHVHRGRTTKQGSRLVSWAAIESVHILPKHTLVGGIRDRVGDHRGRNIGVVAAARRQLEFVFYALRDHRVQPPPVLMSHLPSSIVSRNSRVPASPLGRSGARAWLIMSALAQPLEWAGLGRAAPARIAEFTPDQASIRKPTFIRT